MKITKEFLLSLEACRDQVELFCELYPDGLSRVTGPVVRRALREGLDVEWLLDCLSEALWVEYIHQRAPLWAEYARQRAALRVEYDHQRAAILTEYDRQRASLGAEYSRQHAAIRDEYERQCAPLLAACIRTALSSLDTE